ncbi:MAG TPA: spore germination protein GerW family protein [Thermoanaerobaculia bacterium]|nr:spore germination protein GerW family protein [Thermoanaerobaculia bacterium]
MADESLLERIAQLINVHADAKQVYGDPVERDGTTIIPVANVQWGFGGGSMGQGLHERGGGGGGVRATPAGFIQIRNGEAEFRHYRDASDLALLAGAALAGAAIGLLFGKSRRG